MAKTIKVLINGDGTVEVDQIGWNGKACSGDISDLLDVIGKEKKVTKKQDYFKDNKVEVQQRW